MKNLITTKFTKKDHNTADKLPIPGKIKQGCRIYCAAVIAVSLLLCCAVPAYATDDPLVVIGNLSDFSAPVSGR